jgi:hypothetical protein
MNRFHFRSIPRKATIPFLANSSDGTNRIIRPFVARLSIDLLFPDPFFGLLVGQDRCYCVGRGVETGCAHHGRLWPGKVTLNPEP